MTFTRLLSFPLRLLVAGILILWDAVIPRRKPRPMKIVNQTSRPITVHYDRSQDAWILVEPPIPVKPLALYEPSEN